MTKQQIENLLRCGLRSFSYDFSTRTATLALPPDHCTDMRGAIQFAQRLDRRVQRVVTIAGGTRDTVYVCVRRDDWKAFVPAETEVQR